MCIRVRTSYIKDQDISHPIGIVFDCARRKSPWLKLKTPGQTDAGGRRRNMGAHFHLTNCSITARNCIFRRNMRFSSCRFMCDFDHEVRSLLVVVAVRMRLKFHRGLESLGDFFLVILVIPGSLGQTKYRHLSFSWPPQKQKIIHHAHTDPDL